jgi:ribulose-phosphate 3-epimerase
VFKIAPSILAADFACLGDEIKKAEVAGADMIHLDIMDGHFVPNISFGAALSEMSTTVTSLPHDAHLMVTDPENYIDDLAAIGVEYIAFHLEIGGRRTDLGKNRWVYEIDRSPDSSRINSNIDLIRSSGRKAGLTLNPPTDFEMVEPFLADIDLLLLMSVNPGFAGQKFIPSVYNKLEAAVEYRRGNGLIFEIMIDGGVGVENAEKLVSMGADILVSGSSFFKSPDFQEFIRRLKA